MLTPIGPEKSRSLKLLCCDREKWRGNLAGARVSLAAKKFAGARAAGKVSLIDDDAATGKCGLRHS